MTVTVLALGQLSGRTIAVLLPDCWRGVRPGAAGECGALGGCEGDRDAVRAAVRGVGGSLWAEAVRRGRYEERCQSSPRPLPPLGAPQWFGPAGCRLAHAALIMKCEERGERSAMYTTEEAAAAATYSAELIFYIEMDPPPPPGTDRGAGLTDTPGGRGRD